jgi:hypothetical protein
MKRIENKCIHKKIKFEHAVPLGNRQYLPMGSCIDCKDIVIVGDKYNIVDKKEMIYIREAED